MITPDTEMVATVKVFLDTEFPHHVERIPTLAILRLRTRRPSRQIEKRIVGEVFGSAPRAMPNTLIVDLAQTLVNWPDNALKQAAEQAEQAWRASAAALLDSFIDLRVLRAGLTHKNLRPVSTPV